MVDKSNNEGNITNIRLSDIAAALGISKATVSLAINNNPKVSEKTRQKVLKKIKELGYVYNRGAAGLSTGKSNTIGLAVHNLSNPYFTKVCSAVESVLSDKGRMPFLCNTHESLDLQKKFIEALIEHRADGLLLCPADQTTIDDLQPLFTRNLATVLIARDIEEAPLDFVGNDGRKALKLVSEHLIKLGHRRIAMIGGGQHTSVSISRRAGFLSALESHEIPLDESLVVDCETSPAGGEAAIVEVINSPDPPTAVVCFSDLIALGVLSGLHHRSYVPGKDMAVVGCDDIEEASRGYVQLTTARIQKSAIGKKSAEMLLERIAVPTLPPRRILLEPELIVRKTCGSRL
ncbi:MAG: LacI family DNA-binding transcriptional regulator [Desulfofustis sp.]|nr:LacI family DNA-binding transcriptional regulator [Desulfofustis sp.]